MKDNARWETNWETRPETSPARRTQHPSQGEVGDKWGDKLGDRRQAQRGGHSTPAKADTLKTALRTPTVNCLGKKKGGGGGEIRISKSQHGKTPEKINGSSSDEISEFGAQKTYFSEPLGLGRRMSSNR